MPLPDVVSGLLLSASCGFNSRQEHRFFATMIVKIHCCIFLFYGACEHRKNIKMSNWSTEKTKRAPRTKSIQAPKKTQSEITTSESAVKKQEEFEEMKKKTRNMMFGLAAVFVLAVAGMAAYKAMH